MTTLSRKFAAAFIAAKPFHSLTLAHIFLLLWLLVTIFFAAQYVGSLVFPGLVGAWNDPSISEPHWSWSEVEQ